MRFLSLSIPKRAGLIAAVIASLIGVSAVTRLYPQRSEIAEACAKAVSRGLTDSQFPFAICTNESPLVSALVGGLIAASVYGLGIFVVLVLVGFGVRKARHRPSAASMSQESLAARISPETTAGERRTEPPAGPVAPRRWFRPTPLLIAIGASLAWAVLSVGPSSLAEDIDQLIPRDTVTAPFCGDGQPVQADGGCSSTLRQQYIPPAWWSCVGIPECDGGPIIPEVNVTVPPQCASPAVPSQGSITLPIIGGPSRSPEADGKCHERSGGTVEPLMNDAFRGGQSGLLAFLAVGAALLLWPRLRAASSRVDDGLLRP